MPAPSKPEPKPSKPEPTPEPKPEDTPSQTLGIAEEQRARSDEIARTGVEAWKEAHDERPLDQRTNRQIPGVGPTTASSSVAPRDTSSQGGPQQGSTPEARRYQNPTAPA